jgi:hypothetical protein
MKEVVIKNVKNTAIVDSGMSMIGGWIKLGVDCWCPFARSCVSDASVDRDRAALVFPWDSGFIRFVSVAGRANHRG